MTVTVTVTVTQAGRTQPGGPGPGTGTGGWHWQAPPAAAPSLAQPESLSTVPSQSDGTVTECQPECRGQPHWQSVPPRSRCRPGPGPGRLVTRRDHDSEHGDPIIGRHGSAARRMFNSS